MATEKYLPEGSDENQFDSEELPLAPFPDGIQNSERYPDTKRWSEQQRAEYLEKNKPLIRSVISRVRNIPDAALGQDDSSRRRSSPFGWLWTLITLAKGRCSLHTPTSACVTR